MTRPIDMMFNGVDWVPADRPETDDGLPYPTYTGVVEILPDMRFQCARLSDGQTIFYGEAFDAWLRDVSNIAGSHGEKIRALIDEHRIAFTPESR